MQKQGQSLYQVEDQIWKSKKFYIQPEEGNNQMKTTLKYQHTLIFVRKFYKAAGIIFYLQKENKLFMCLDDFIGLVRCPAGKLHQGQIPLVTALREFNQEVFDKKQNAELFWTRIKEYIISMEAYLVYGSKMVNFFFVVDQGIKKILEEKKYYCFEMNANFEWIAVQDLQIKCKQLEEIKKQKSYRSLVDKILQIPLISIQKIEEHMLTLKLLNMNLNNEKKQDQATKHFTRHINQLVQLHNQKYKDKQESKKKLKGHVQQMKLYGKEGFFVSLISNRLISRLLKK